MPGYGDRIYKKKQTSHLPLIIISVLILLGGGFLFLYKSNLVDLGQVADTIDAGIPSDETADGIPAENVSDSTVSDADTVESDMISSGEPVVSDSTSGTESDSLVAETEFARVADGAGSADVRNDLMEAKRHLFDSNFRDALPLLKKHASLHNNALILTGVCHYKLDQYDDARRCLENGLSKDNANFVALKYLAFTLYKQDELENSLQYARKGLEVSMEAELKYLHDKILREQKTMKYYGDTEKVNFRIQFSRFEHEESKEKVLDILKEAYRTIGQEIGHFPKEPVTVILYNDKGFFDVTRAPGWAGGLYDGKIRIPVKNMEGKDELLKRVLYHEYVHALVHDITIDCPLWLNEGLAEYFSEEDLPKVGQIIPLQLLEHRFPSGPVKAVALAYVESYSAVCHLIERYGMYRVKELLDALGKGDDISTAFDKVLMVSYDRFLETWGKE